MRTLLIFFLTSAAGKQSLAEYRCEDSTDADRNQEPPTGIGLAFFIGISSLHFFRECIFSDTLLRDCFPFDS